MRLGEILSRPRTGPDVARLNPPPGCGTCGKVKAIMLGFGRLAYDRIVGRRPEPWVIVRAALCNACERRTWLSPAAWAAETIGGRTLPIVHERADGTHLFCAVCRCCVEAKIRVESEHCPEGRW